MVLAASYARTLRVTTRLYSVGPNSRIVVPSCAFISATSTFMLGKTGVMFISVEPSAVGVSRGLVRTTIARGAGIVIPIRCTKITYRVSAVVRVTGGCGLGIIRSTTRKMSTYCGKGTLNAVKSFKYCDFRRAGGCAVKRNNTVLFGESRCLRGTRVLERGKASEDGFFHKRVSGCH